MFKKLLLLSFSWFHIAISQTVDVPKGVVYKYADDKTNKKAEELIRKELSGKKYSLFDNYLSIGPNLWDRYKEAPELNAIEGGNLELHKPVLNSEGQKTGIEIHIGKFIQDKTDFKKVWDYFSNECKNQEIIFRKLNKEELKYFWSMIPFDIEEPVFIMESKKHKYIIDITDKSKLLWMDEVK